MKIVPIDEYRHLNNQEYNLLTFYSGHERDTRSYQKAWQAYSRLVEAGYSKDCAKDVIKKVFLIDLDKHMQGII